MKKFLLIVLAGVCLGVQTASAHQPIISNDTTQSLNQFIVLENAQKVPDPVTSSLAVYGRLENSGDVKLYSFVATSSTEIPIETLVPLRDRNINFRPWTAILGRNLSGNKTVAVSAIPFVIPQGYEVALLPPIFGQRDTVLEPYSREKLYRGRQDSLRVVEGATYYLAVFSPEGAVGDFSLAVGTAENFSSVGIGKLAAGTIALKLGLVGGKFDAIPFAALLLIIFGAAFSVGGLALLVKMVFLGYWRPWWTALALRTQAFISAYVFGGIIVQIIGSSFLYHKIGLTGLAPVAAVCEALAIAGVLYIYFKAREYRWIVVRVALHYDRHMGALTSWRWRTLCVSVFVILSLIVSTASAVWFALYLS